MRISDWSSDVCSSDLQGAGHVEHGGCRARVAGQARSHSPHAGIDRPAVGKFDDRTISGREPLCIGRTNRGLHLHLAGIGHAEQRTAEHTTEYQSLMRNLSADLSLTKKKQKKT